MMRLSETMEEDEALKVVCRDYGVDKDWYLEKLRKTEEEDARQNRSREYLKFGDVVENLITSKDMSSAIVNHCRYFSPRQNFLIIENLSWGIFDWGECDLLIISKSHFATEIEIKISISDLKADFKKKKWTPNFIKSHDEKIKKFFYAIPEELSEKALELINENNPGAGLISIRFKRYENGIIMTPIPRIVKNPTENCSKKFTEKQLLDIARLAMFRYWKDLKTEE